ncbi:MAG: GldG family protein [Myxococcales bacterium]|jgi:ABC-type uncharacterized transport system involved in gliding motility auxiliary subunit
MKLKYAGRILGVLGLVILASSTITFIIGAPLSMVVGKIILAGFFFASYAVTNWGDLGASASSRGTFFFGVSAIGALLVVALLGMGNYIVHRKPKSWDLTKAQIHTLSPDTLKTLDGLKEDVTALAFYRSGEPSYEALADLFRRYGERSPHFKYEFVDPIKDPMRVEQYGIRDGGPRVVVKLGATESRFQELSEESLTNAIVKVTHSATKKLYFTTGHGEADFEDEGPTGLSAVKQRMENEGLVAAKLNLAAATEIPKDAEAIVIAGPAKPFQPGEVDAVRRYLDAGGKAFLMLEPSVESGLELLLEDFNVQADNATVIDPISRLFGASEAIPVVQSYNQQSEITRDFTLNTVFPTARPITVLHGGASKAVASPLALTMPSAWGETDLTTPEVKQDEHEKGGPFPLVVTVTLDTKGAENKRSDEARLVVAGDRDFATNKFRAAYGNEDFFLNGLNWLAAQTERITIRPRLREASRLFLSPVQQAGIFFLTVDILPVTLLGLGLVVWMVRRSK